MLGLGVGSPKLLLGDDPPPTAQCTAPSDCLGEAVRAVAQGNHEAAARVLLDLIRQFPETPWEGRASLLLGKLYQDRDDPRAVQYLLNVPRHLPLLGDYAHYQLGEALFKSNAMNGAATAFDLLVVRYPDSLVRPRALQRSVEAWFQGEDCRRARERVGRFLEEFAGHPLAPAVLLRQGDCQQKGGETPGAINTYRRVWTQYAGTPQASEAAVRLQQLRDGGVALPELTPKDWWLRAKTLFDAGQYAPAAAGFEEVLKFSQGAPNRDQARLKLGIARVRLKQYEEARRAFADLVRSRAGSDSQEAMVWLARVLLRQGQDDQLLALAREVEAGALSGDLKTRFLLLVAALHADRGRMDKAVGTYRKAGEEAGQEGLAAEAFWQAGWLLYKGGQYQEAIRSFDQAVRRQAGGPHTWAAYYWKARSLDKAGEPEKSAGVLQALCGEAPHSFYCLSARVRAGGVREGVTNNGATGSQAVSVPDPREDTVNGDVHYQRAQELRLVGWLKEAGEELASLTSRAGRDRGGILWLARLLEGAGDSHRALTLVQQFFPDVLERGSTEVPQTFWELAYPKGYLPRIQELSRTQAVDPHLVAAVIREESTYNPAAVSQAGAIGLMQVMPQTGQRIATRLGAEGFTRERLFDPDFNIRLGTWYLGQLAEQFDHNLIHMVAAYNAGPEVVAKWIQQFGQGEPDEFIESIPYTETRFYVKKVLRTYREYKRIYAAECRTRFLDKAC
jgi:soluble lytic murein transglycosylase